MHLCIPSCALAFIHSLTHSLTHSLARSLARSLIHLFTWTFFIVKVFPELSQHEIPLNSWIYRKRIAKKDDKSLWEKNTNRRSEKNTKHWSVSVVPGRCKATDSSWVKVPTLSPFSELEASLSNNWSDFENGSIASWYFSRAKKLEPSRYCACMK